MYYLIVVLTSMQLLIVGINKMSISNISIRLSTCANCGKEGSDSDMNTCNKCKSVKYCNAACKKKHRSKHKKKCDRRVAELHDEKLFKQPPPEEDCPICFLLMPSLWSGDKYMTCCGKLICSGCIYAGQMTVGGGLCPFCRTPTPTMDDQFMKHYEKRVELDDAHAIYDVACIYSEGKFGCPQNYTKALELFHRAAELGHSGAYYNIGNAYLRGKGVQQDMEQARHYWEQAAIRGSVTARCNLGIYEQREGNMDRALKHWMIAARVGCRTSLRAIKDLFMNGHATKDDYGTALRAHQAYLDSIRSDQRDQAAAVSDDFKYY